MRYHGRARISRSSPQALGVCDRCGALYNHNRLIWQFAWQGPRLQNIRQLVCPSCYDKPFEHHRTLILPPDPVAIPNPRFENYTSDDNPISGLSWDPLQTQFGATTVSGNLGSMTAGAGIDAPFSGPTGKAARFSAFANPSLNGANNWVGKNWSAIAGVVPAVPTMFSTPGLQYAINSVTLYSPSDMAFLQGGTTTVEFDGWSGSSWFALWTGNSVGSVGETLTIASSQLTNTNAYYGHRVLLGGDGVNAVGIAAVVLQAGGAGVLTSSEPVVPS